MAIPESEIKRIFLQSFPDAEDADVATVPVMTFDGKTMCELLAFKLPNGDITLRIYEPERQKLLTDGIL